MSFLQILSEIHEKLVVQQMTEFIEKQLIYYKCQSGYRKNHSYTFNETLRRYQNIHEQD